MTSAGIGGPGHQSPEPHPQPGHLLRDATSLIDLRSPGEFARGALPAAVNLPLLTDAERHDVGLTYRAAGQSAAIELGEELVSGAVRADRLQAWMTFAEAHPDCWLYCWRGGLRSEIAQRWLSAAGVEMPRVPGGFKALRQACITLLEGAPGARRWLVLGGRTGSGKTRLLEQVPQSIDLEALANHRGSAFGAYETEQPNPVDFENRLAARTAQHSHELLVVEDESRTIGRLALPGSWHAAMQQAPLVILEVPLASRVANIRREYVDEPLAGGLDAQVLRERFTGALDRIRKRLGGARHESITRAVRAAFDQPVSNSHEAWIESLLSDYYDPMYDYQLEQKSARVSARGSARQVLDFIATC